MQLYHWVRLRAAKCGLHFGRGLIVTPEWMGLWAQFDRYPNHTETKQSLQNRVGQPRDFYGFICVVVHVFLRVPLHWTRSPRKSAKCRYVGLRGDARPGTD